MTRNIVLLTLAAASLLNSSLVLGQKNTTVVTAVGQYDAKTSPTSRDTIAYPLLLQSNDAGMTWTPKNFKTILPKNYNGYGIFNSIYCGDNNCLLVGTYRDSKDKNHPLLYKSSDNGINWTLVTALPKDYLNDGIFYDVNCDKMLCIAVGYYRNKNDQWQPLLAVSQNVGLTWFYPETIITNLPANASTPEFKKAYCKDQLCSAVGQYTLGINTTMPLLAKSTDGGATWNYVSTLPDDYAYRGILNNINYS